MTDLAPTRPKLSPEQTRYKRVAHLTRLFYDLQRGRIAYELRVKDGPDSIELAKEDLDFLETIDKSLGGFEKLVQKQANTTLKGHPVYEWLISQKGVSVTLAPVLMGAIDIYKTPTVSAFHRLCGLAVDNRTGRAERRVKGEKCKFNPHLKSRCFLLAECLIKANNVEYRKHYDDRKNRRRNQLVPCMLCNGTGVYVAEPKPGPQADIDADTEQTDTTPAKRARKPKVCTNCNGVTRTNDDGTTVCVGPWGRSDKHRHMDALRYMAKMFLRDMWVLWRTHEGLEVRVPYAEEYLGRKHHT